MQSFPTVLIPFDSSHADRVDARLDTMGNPAGQSIKEALDRLQIVHFTSLCVVRDAGPQGAILVLEASVDGDSRGALAQIADALRQPLLDLLHDAGIGVSAPGLAAFLIAHDTAIGTGWRAPALGLCFPGTPGMTVPRILQEQELAQRISRMDGVLTHDRSALAKLDRVRAALWAEADTKWAFAAEPLPWLDAKPRPTVRAFHAAAPFAKALAWPLLPLLALAWLWRPAAAGVLLVAALAAVAAALLRLRYLERTDHADDEAPDAGRVREAMSRENFGAQNLLISVTDLKPGWLRRLTLRIAFTAVGQMAAEEFQPGFLSTIGTIHFARWILLPGTRKLLFLSNYDGSLESYLEDFIQLAHEGVTIIWSNTVGFPRTRWLALDGARDGDRLRRYVLRKQVPARFWYSAYPALTTSRIRANAAIRYGLAAARTEDEAEAWLACFGASGKVVPALSSARPRAALLGAFERVAAKAPSASRIPLEEAKIPTLVFGARKHLRHSACLMVRMQGDPADCRTWLAKLDREVTYGAERQDQALVLALAASALGAGKLELPESDLATFSPPFLNGMASPCRTRALGDQGDNAPEKWAWGGDTTPVDALVIAYDADPERLQQRLEALRTGIADSGHVVAYSIKLSPAPERGQRVIEPFGFTDGVSQPLIRGAPGEHAAGAAVEEAGEFVLGYRDNSGYLPPTPTVAAEHDPNNLLCGPRCPSAGRRDLGRNGTYLAVRQLSQDKEGFEAWLRDAALQVQQGATSLASVPACAMEHVLAAKVVGRWRNGSALAQHPATPGMCERNDFLYGSLDAAGLGCPLGAHARRANPRDSLDPGSDQQLAINARHRILRVGRQYDAAGPGEQPGLLFMSVGADIGRQFEFVQQTWLLGRSFHGLENEDDPVIGQGRPGVERTFTIHTGQGPVRLRIRKTFVSVKGGGYFFMPGRDTLRFLAGVTPAHQADLPAQPSEGQRQYTPSCAAEALTPA